MRISTDRYTEDRIKNRRQFEREAPLDIELQDMLVLAIDCQTSGSNVEKSQLLEIGWLPLRAAEIGAGKGHLPSVHLIQPPDDWDLPGRIEKMTGIDGQKLRDGVSPHRAWQDLYTTASQLAAANGLEHCPAVIHFARFEMGFIKKLTAQSETGLQIPIEAICTHQIASRLLPSLPRKGLRAVAGYFGHSVGKQKRCRDHLLATRSIWQNLVQCLDAEHGITTLEQLRQWLKIAPQPATAKRVYPMPREARLHLPNAPGVYYLRRSNGDLLYIGKAANLRQRINSYFQAGSRHSEKNLEMLSQAAQLDIIETPSALEAALLESDEIKTHKPPYNHALTNDHRQLYFLSRDFMHQKTQPDRLCKLGPVTPVSPFDAAAAISNCLDVDSLPIDAADVPNLLAMPQRYCPDIACLQSGLDLFKAKHHDLLRHTRSLDSLMRIGRWSWIEKMSKENVSEPPDMEKQEAAQEATFEWTPEVVVKSLESLARHCGFLLRRARWLTMLSEATLSWQVKLPSSDLHNFIILNSGNIAERFVSKSADSLPDPPGASLPFTARQSNLDLHTYDRLRVLTTELRRLKTEKRPLCICLRKNVFLRESQIQALLRWI